MHSKISLIGNVGNQPEIKTVGDIKVASISLGVTEKGYTTKDGKKVEDKTMWFRVGLWRGLAEIVEKYVSKGDRLFVEGKMTSREYEKDGVKHTVWEVTATELELLTPKKDGNSQPAQPSPAPAQQAQYDGASDLPF